MADETLAPTQDDQELLSAEFGGAFAHMLQTGSWQGHIENVPIAKALRAIASARLQGREEAARVADIRVKRAQFAVDSHGAGPHAEAFAAELVVAQSIAASIRALSPSRVVDDVEGPRTKIFDHKWLDPSCVENGCMSLGLIELHAVLAEGVEPPTDPHTNAWLLGFCRARKTIATTIRAQRQRYEAAALTPKEPTT